MHQSTVRFSADLWREVQAECAGLGVSIAQYLREAAIARLAYAAARRGDVVYEAALEESVHARALAAYEHAQSGSEGSEAVFAQGELARARALELRAQSEARRRSRART